MEEMDDIPDLDDMSDLVQGIKQSQEKRMQQAQLGSTPEVTLVEKSDQGAKRDEEKKPTVSKKKEFAGMKKGFLFGSAKKNATPKPQHTQSSSKPKMDNDVISPKLAADKQKNPLVLDEVQDAMKESMIGDKSWITEDLLNQVQSNEKLSKQLSDPRIAQAVNMMQKDPAAAVEYYKADTEIQAFFKEFYGILGNHFTNLGAQQSQNTAESSKVNSEDEKAMQHILSNPEIREILMKPGIQKLLELLRNDPDEAQKHLNSNDASFRADVNKLVSAGVLAFQPH